MIDEVKGKLSKVLALAKAGATEGEKDAASRALYRLIQKYNISPDELENINKSKVAFKYTTQLEMWLLGRLVSCLLENKAQGTIWTGSGKKEVTFELDYFDTVTLSASYEYFRRHMKGEWNKYCAVEVKRCRKAKTRNKKRKELQPVFFNSYCIASKLYKTEELISIDTATMSQKELENRRKMAAVEGGQYRKQMKNGLLLEMS